MGKSYKRTPSVGRNSRGMKKIASRKSRRILNKLDAPLNGQQYKKFFQSYDIKDHFFLAPDFEDWCERERECWKIWPEYTRKRFGKSSLDFPSEKELRKLYNAIYKRK